MGRYFLKKPQTSAGRKITAMYEKRVYSFEGKNFTILSPRREYTDKILKRPAVSTV